MCRILNIDSFHKKFIIALVGGFIRFVLFKSMYFFTNKWAANFEMVLFIGNMTNFFISWTFASGMWTIAKFTLFYKVSCVLIASVMIRLIWFLFKFLLEFRGHGYVFPQQHGLRILEGAFHEGSYLCWHIQSYPWLENPGGYQYHIQNLIFLIHAQNHESFDSLVAENGYVFHRVTVFRKFV